MENCAVHSEPVAGAKVKLLPGVLAILLSLPWCCILPPLIAVIAGQSGGGLPPLIRLLLLPFLAWPALLWTHYKYWNNLAKCFQDTRFKRRLNTCIVIVATCIFTYSFTTDYLPTLRGYLAVKKPVPVCGMKNM